MANTPRLEPSETHETRTLQAAVGQVELTTLVDVIHELGRSLDRHTEVMEKLGARLGATVPSPNPVDPALESGFEQLKKALAFRSGS